MLVIVEKGENAFIPLIAFGEPVLKGQSIKVVLLDVVTDAPNSRERGQHRKRRRLLARFVDDVGNKVGEDVHLLRVFGFVGGRIHAELVVGADEKKAKIVL